MLPYICGLGRFISQRICLLIQLECDSGLIFYNSFSKSVGQDDTWWIAKGEKYQFVFSGFTLSIFTLPLSHSMFSLLEYMALNEMGVNCLRGFLKTFLARTKSFVWNSIRNSISQDIKHKTAKHQKTIGCLYQQSTNNWI